MAIFSEKIARIAQLLGASPPGPYSRNLSSRTQFSQSTTLKIVVTGFLNKQKCSNKK